MLLKMLNYLLINFLFLVVISCSSSYQLTGRVQDYSSKFIPSAEVIIKDLNKNDSVKTITDIQGQFSKEIKSSNIEVIIRAPNYLPLSKRLQLKDKLTYEFFELKNRPTTISGIIIDKNKKPIASVKVIDANGRILGFTNEKGKFSISDKFNPDLTLNLTFQREGYNPVYRSINPKLYQDNNLQTIILEPITKIDPKTTMGVERFSVADKPMSNETMNIPNDPTIGRFLKEKEQFTFQDFADELRRVDPNLTDEQIVQQLKAFMNLRRVEEIEDGIYKSLDYESDR